MSNSRLVINAHEHPRGKDAILKMNAEMGIDASVLLSVGTDAMEHSLELAREHPKAFVPFYFIDPDGDLAEEPQRLRQAVEEHGFRGIKFQPMDQHWLPSDRRLYPIYATCAELGLMCTWHMGMVKLGQGYEHRYELGVPMLSRYTHPMPLDQVAFDFPELVLCIAHIGGNYHYEALILAEKHENVYVDTAFLPFFCARFIPRIEPGELIRHAVRQVGAHKVLYGCEGLWPATIEQLDLSDEEKQLILAGNACRLLDLDYAVTAPE